MTKIILWAGRQISDGACLAFTGLETSNRYQIKNTLGQQIFFAGEGQSDYIAGPDLAGGRPGPSLIVGH